jgi:hypothetical protein
MAGLQTIIDNASSLSINRRQVVGIQYTRNEIPRTSVTPTKNPWRFTVELPNSLRYSEARALMEELDKLDRYTPEIISFNNLSAMSWIFKYQGAMTTGNIAACTVSTFVGNTLTINVPVLTAGTSLFKKNDVIQIGGAGVYPYPFTSTTDVVYSGSTAVITTNRPNILTGSLAGLGIIVGNNCQWKMFCPNMPTYKLIPGGYINNLNNAYLEFSDAFELYEYVGTA